jgi:hypothetical protein
MPFAGSGLQRHLYGCADFRDLKPECFRVQACKNSRLDPLVGDFVSSSRWHDACTVDSH